MNRLEKYQVIAWDFDGTIFDSPQSEIIADYIRTNPFDQTHTIVTFRSHGLEDMIEGDMEPLGLSVGHFDKIITVPEALYEAYSMNRDYDKVKEYKTWKARMAVEIGAGVLIDDDTENVILGCAEFNVDHIHPDTLNSL